jgi:hypothetical protein
MSSGDSTKGSPGKADSQRMEQFHKTPWIGRYALAIAGTCASTFKK